MTSLLLAAVAAASWGQAPENVNLVARPGVADTWTLQARWTTADATIGSAEWGASDALGNASRPEPVECNNHRADILGLAIDEACWVKLPGGETTRVEPPPPSVSSNVVVPSCACSFWSKGAKV